MALEKICPACSYKNLATSLFCGADNCGVSLVAVHPTQDDEAGPQSHPPESISCPECHGATLGDAERCIYCGAQLHGPETSEPMGCRIEFRWPWGVQALDGLLRIGRDPPAPAELIAAIEARGYDNISRSHAEFVVSNDSVAVIDLGSANGTFVDGVKIPCNTPIPLRHGAVVRFAANLAVEVSIRRGKT